MDGGGLDKARALLEPFRFNFPRVVISLITYRAESNHEVKACIDKTLMAAALNAFPPHSAIIRQGWDTIAYADPEQEIFGLYKITTQQHSADIKLLETVAGYAGSTIDICTVPQSFWTFPGGDDTDPDAQVEPELRWFVKLLSDSRYGFHPHFSDPKITGFLICNDAFGSTWKRLNELLLPVSQVLPPEPQDEEEREIIELLRAVGHRLTTSKLLSEFESRGSIKAESTIKLRLSRMVPAGLLTNRQDVRPHRGYGLPEWD